MSLVERMLAASTGEELLRIYEAECGVSYPEVRKLVSLELQNDPRRFMSFLAEFSSEELRLIAAIAVTDHGGPKAIEVAVLIHRARAERAAQREGTVISSTGIGCFISPREDESAVVLFPRWRECEDRMIPPAGYQIGDRVYFTLAEDGLSAASVWKEE